MDATAQRPRIIDVVFGASQRSSRLILGVAAFVGLGTHAWLWALGARGGEELAAWTLAIAHKAHEELAKLDSVELDKPKAKEPDKPPPPPPPPDRDQAPVAAAEHPASAPAPAQAGRIIAADPGAPADFTGGGFVQGDADMYAGGATPPAGISTSAVDPAPIEPPPRPVAASKPAPPPPSAPDLSRPVAMLEQNWSCAWPSEADAEAIDQQVAVVAVTVDESGRVSSARVVSDPGHGFGRAAVRCARGVRFAPARDRDGHPVRAVSPPIRVHFSR
jgi:periplasmic protein TonB